MDVGLEMFIFMGLILKIPVLAAASLFARLSRLNIIWARHGHQCAKS